MKTQTTGLKTFIVYHVKNDNTIIILNSFNSRLQATKYGEKCNKDVNVLPKGIFCKKYPDEFEKFYKNF